MKILKLKQIFNNFNSERLIKIIKQYPGNYYNGLDRDGLQKILINIIVNQKKINNWFIYATETDIKFIEDLINNKVKNNEEINFPFYYWNKSNLMYYFDDELIIAQELIDNYYLFNRKSYQRNQEIELYIRCFVNCYFVIDIDKAIELLNFYSSQVFTKTEVINFLINRANNLDTFKYFYKDNLIINTDVFILIDNTISSYQAFYGRQQSSNYKIYSKSEILHYENSNYVKKTTAFQAIVDFLKYYFDITEKAAISHTNKLILMARCEYPPIYLVQYCHKNNMQFKKEIDERMLLNLFMQLVNRIDLPQNRGFTAIEITNNEILI